MDQAVLPTKEVNYFPAWMSADKNKAPSEVPVVSSDNPPPVVSNNLPVNSDNDNDKKRKILIGLIGLVMVVGLGFLFYKVVLKKKVFEPKVTLNYWGLFEPSEVFQQVISDYEKQHPQVKVLYQNSKLTEYRERLQNSLSTKEGPDIFRVHQSWIPMFANSLSLVPADVFDTNSFEKTFYSSAKETLKYQGQYVAIPLMVDGLALYYNEDLFKAAGKTPPRTWEELAVTARELTIRDQQGKIRTAGVALGATNVDHWSDILALMMLQNAADLSNPAACSDSEALVGKICPGADALSYFTMFTKIDRSWDATLPSSTFAFATGNLAMYFGPSWRVFDIESIKKDYKSNVNYKIIPVPQLQGVDVNWSTYWVEAVSKNSPNQKEAWEFLKYLSSKEVMQKLYQTERSFRPFGEPFSRIDMADLLKTEPLISSFIQQAPTAKSWYLSSSTKDNGINDKIIKYYEDALNAVNRGEDPVTALTTTAQGVKQVLGQYGLLR